MISSTDGLCFKLKEISGLYVKAQKLQLKYKSLDTSKKKRDAVSYQKEAASYMWSISTQLSYLDSRSKGIIYISFDSPYNWENYFYTQRKNIEAGKYTTAESFKILTEMLKLVKKIYTTILKVATNLNKASISYMNAIDKLIAKHGRGTDKAIPAAPLKKFITVLEQPTSDATDFFIDRLFYHNTYNDISRAIAIGDVSDIGKPYGNVHANLKTITKNSAEALKYLKGSKIHIK